MKKEKTIWASGKSLYENIFYFSFAFLPGGEFLKTGLSNGHLS